MPRTGSCAGNGSDVPRSVRVCPNEKFDLTGIRRPLDSRGDSPMPLRLEVAAAEKWLSAEAVTVAKEVWRRGSKAGHSDPEVVTQGLDTIRKTLVVLNELYAPAHDTES